MIDLHCHVLPGIDDGCRTIAESLALSREAAAQGARTLVATPHVSRRYPNDADTIAALVDELNDRLEVERVGLEVQRGAEIASSQVPRLDRRQLERLRLGAGRWLLIEPPFAPRAPALRSIVEGLLGDGHQVVLAHPERCPAFHRDPAMLESLIDAGALTSVTAGSLVGRFGGDARNFALDLAGAGMLHNVASDAHDRSRRPPGVSEALAHAGLGAIAEWLTDAVPAAILAGAPIPSRPAPAFTPGGGGLRGVLRRRERRRPTRVSRWPQR